MTKHFQCTACGKCCFGLLPLTCKDALANAHRFPLCFVWTPINQDSPDFAMTSKLGITLKIARGKKLAVLIVPTSFIPSTFPCPALLENNHCAIHLSKPSRCKAMPFYPYREERFQGAMLSPRQGWQCDTSASAPLVYQDKKILDRESFDIEKSDLLEQVPLLQRYYEYMIKYTPSFINTLIATAQHPKGGYTITSLTTFLLASKNPEIKQIATQQLPLLNNYIEKTANDAKLVEFHKNYVIWAKEMSYLSK